MRPRTAPGGRGLVGGCLGHLLCKSVALRPKGCEHLIQLNCGHLTWGFRPIQWLFIHPGLKAETRRFEDGVDSADPGRARKCLVGSKLREQLDHGGCLLERRLADRKFALPGRRLGGILAHLQGGDPRSVESVKLKIIRSNFTRNHLPYPARNHSQWCLIGDP